jgi:hypothetical protein
LTEAFFLFPVPSLYRRQKFSLLERALADLCSGLVSTAGQASVLALTQNRAVAPWSVCWLIYFPHCFLRSCSSCSSLSSPLSFVCYRVEFILVFWFSHLGFSCCHRIWESHSSFRFLPRSRPWRR